MIDSHKIKVIELISSTKERIDAYIDYLFEIRKFNPEKSIEIANEVIRLAEQIDDKLGQGRALNHKGFCHTLKADYQEALVALDKAMMLAKAIPDQGLEARVNKNYGTVYRDLGKLSDAFSYYEEAILIYEKLGRETELGGVLLQISNLHLDLYEYENALEYALRCITLFESPNVVKREAEVRYTLGNIYFKQENFACANDEFEKSRSLSEPESINYMLAEIGLGQVSCQLGNYKIAKEILELGLAQAKVLDHIEGRITAHYYLGKVLFKREHLQNAKKHFKRAYELAVEHSRRHNVMSIHGMLSELYEKMGRIDKAFFHLKAFEKLKEEIFQQNTINKLRHLQTKQEIELATKEKEVATKTATLKQQFIANMSHEIRTPMNAILGMTRILNEKEPRADQTRYLGYIEQSANNLLVIINDILDFSKIEAGKVRIEKINFSLKDALKNVVNTLRIKAEEKGLKLWFEMKNNVPSSVQGDPTRLTQILINLVGNAIKFTEKGRVDIVVFLEKIEGDNHYVKFQVIDTGIGISEDYVHKIFESFSQAGTDLARKYGGTGLGLTISKELVELMSGSIGVKSELGEGTTFEFTIPFVLSNMQLTHAQAKVFTLSDEEKWVLNNMHVLLAEDNEFNKILAEDVLQDMAPKMRISHAENGIEVLEFLQDNAVDLVLMDIQMPLMNGLEATKEIRKTNKELPIIAMTANVMQDDIETYLDNGMDSHVPKPFTKEDLFTKILKHVNREKLKMIESNAEATNAKDKVTEEPEPIASMQYIDDSFLLSFTNGKADKMKKYIHLFLDNAPQMLERLEQAVVHKNHAEIKIAAHSLKSQLNYLGVAESQSGVYALEQMGTNQTDFDIIKIAFEKLKVVLHATFIEARNKIASLE